MSYCLEDETGYSSMCILFKIVPVLFMLAIQI